MWSKFQITKKSMVYSTQKLVNWGFTYFGVCFTMKIGHRNSRSPRSPWTITHNNRQNRGFTYSGDRLTMKMGRFGCEDQLAP
ncbi:hypothetical protein H5410_044040 [Solanum commersonii]|uniref:Uncharacterized protein n=1 Tax=Solanum commersonii TaxID=4109 RepID=A0A9J5Y328_SOLCO|nr:hypothetical protein H5410_044040 [Solanum commersonii]